MTTPSIAVARLVLPLAAWLPGACLAQATVAATPEACTPITSDPERLACYDAALGRKAAGPEQADAAAIAAAEARESIRAYERFDREALPRPERAQRMVNDLLGSEDKAPGLEAKIANAGKGSLLDSRWELARDSKLGAFNLRAYRPVYLLPAFWTNRRNTLPRSANPDNTVTEPQDLSEVEAKFQLSFKTKVWQDVLGNNGDVWIGYTQSSHWQVFNTETSRPFRETNYEPELMFTMRTNYRIGDWHGRLLGVVLNHQSNGREDPFSRSWNRIIVPVAFDRENWALMLRPWWRIPDGNDDDNPDIDNYIGRGDATLVHTRGDHQFALAWRHSMRSGDDSRGAVQFDWAFPLLRTLRGHVQVFDGYGESLINYNHRATYVGIGLSLLEWY